MPIEVRRDKDIYRKEGGWFTARWHFSFDEYRDPHNRGFGNLRVFNDDSLVPGAVWPLHPHRDIEGLTYVVEGTFRHEDDVGGSPGPLPTGSVQRMTLGSGAWHSEQNASETEPMRFIQMWIMPDRLGLPPGVEQKVLSRDDRGNRLLKAISPDDEEGVRVHGNAAVYISSMEPGLTLDHKFPTGMGGYLYVIKGSLEIDGDRLSMGDAAKIWDEPEIALRAVDETELILVEVDLR
ncbi:MAG TPA: pirin family protein [Actinomycetota bacterium]|nr:pirin family protein [Actinomycetota bacterium]